MDDLTNAGPSNRVCICRQPYDGTAFMIECAMCDGWFHGSCIGLSPQDAVNITEYFCPECSAAHAHDASGHTNTHDSLSGSDNSEDTLSDSDLIAILSRPALPGAGKGKGLGKGKAPRQHTAKAPRPASKAPRKSAAYPINTSSTNGHSHSSKAPRSLSTSAGKAPRGPRTAGKKTLFTHMAASTTDDDNSDTASDAETSSSSSSSSSSSASSDSETDESINAYRHTRNHADVSHAHNAQSLSPTSAPVPTHPSTLNSPPPLEPVITHAGPPSDSTTFRRGGRGGGRGRGRGAASARSRGSPPAADGDSSMSRPASRAPPRVARKAPRITQPLATHSDEGEHDNSRPSELPLTISIASPALSTPLPDPVPLVTRSKPSGRPRKSSFGASRPRSDSGSSKHAAKMSLPTSSSATGHEEPLITESDFEKLLAHSSSQHQSTSGSFGPRLGQAVSSMLLPSLAEDSDAGSSSTRKNKSGTIRVPSSASNAVTGLTSRVSSASQFCFPSNAAARSKPPRSAQPAAHPPSLFPMYPPIPTQTSARDSSTIQPGSSTIPSRPATVTRPGPANPRSAAVDDDETDVETEDDADATVDDDEDDELDDDMCVVCDTKCTCKPKQVASADPLPTSPPKPARSNKNPKRPLPTLPASSSSPPLLSPLANGSAVASSGRIKSRQVTPSVEQHLSSAAQTRKAPSNKRSSEPVKSPPPLRPMAPSTIMSPPTAPRKRMGRVAAPSPRPLPSPPRLTDALPLDETESDEEELVVHVPRPAHHLPPARFGRAPSLGLSDGTVSSGDSTLSDDDSEFASEVLGVLSAHPTGPHEPMDEEDAVRANVSTFAGLAAAALALLSSTDSSSEGGHSDCDMTASSGEEDSLHGADDVTDKAVGPAQQVTLQRLSIVVSPSIQDISDACVTEDELDLSSKSKNNVHPPNSKTLFGLDSGTDVPFPKYQTNSSMMSSLPTQAHSCNGVHDGGSAIELDVLLSTPPSPEFSQARYPSFVQSVVAASSPLLYKDGFKHSASQHTLASRTRKISLKDFGLGFLAPPAKRPRDDHLPTTLEAESPPPKALLTSSHLRASNGEPQAKRQRQTASSLAPIIVNPLTAIANDMATSPFTFKRPDGAPHTPTTPAMLGLDQVVDADLFASSDDDVMAASPSTASPSGRKLRSPHRRDGRVCKVSTTSHAFSAFRTHDLRPSNPADPHRAFKGQTNTSAMFATSLAPLSSPFPDHVHVQPPVPEKSLHSMRRGSLGRPRCISGAAAPIAHQKPSSQHSSERMVHHSAGGGSSTLDMSLELDQWIANPSQSQDLFAFGGDTDSTAQSQDVDPDFMAIDVLFSETQK